MQPRSSMRTRLNDTHARIRRRHTYADLASCLKLSDDSFGDFARRRFHPSELHSPTGVGGTVDGVSIFHDGNKSSATMTTSRPGDTGVTISPRAPDASRDSDDRGSDS